MRKLIFSQKWYWLCFCVLGLTKLSAQTSNQYTQIVISSSWQFQDRLLYIITPTQNDTIPIEDTRLTLKVQGKGQMKIGVGIEQEVPHVWTLVTIDSVHKQYFDMGNFEIKRTHKLTKVAKKVEKSCVVNGNFPPVKEIGVMSNNIDRNRTDITTVSFFIPWKYKDRALQIIADNRVDWIPIDQTQLNVNFYGQGEVKIGTCRIGKEPKKWKTLQINPNTKELKIAKTKREQLPERWQTKKASGDKNCLNSTYCFKVRNTKLKVKRYRKRHLQQADKQYIID